MMRPVSTGSVTLPRPALRDRHGRTATSLRVSLTDRCSLRCSYCLPAAGSTWLPRPDLLTDDEFIRLITIGVRDLGITDVRFTGGEPLLRSGVARIVAATHDLRTAADRPPEVALTTNGLTLRRHAAALREAGLRRINVSLDTLDPERYARITGADRLDDVLAGLAAAKAAGLEPVKVNTVLLRGVNDDEALALVRWAVAEGYQLRFIEQMPLGRPGVWRRDEMVTAAEILAALGAGLELEPVPAAERGSAPAETWYVHGADAPPGTVPTVGIVASVTRAFCGACDRTRLTADGQVLSCLFGHDEKDVRSLLRGGGSDADIAAAWAEAMWAKPAGHGIDKATHAPPHRPMRAIGG
jgi:cyclic pyranopterin phosphate synthase